MLVRRAWVSGNVVDAEGNGDGSPISIYNDSIIYGFLFFLQWYFAMQLDMWIDEHSLFCGGIAQNTQVRAQMAI